MKTQWLVGALLVVAGGCDVVLGIDQAPALQENQDCRKWTCTGKTCDWQNFDLGTACSDSGNSECNGKGQCRLKLGVSCKNASDCSSDQCVDDVCCDSACGGKCQTCSSGHCVNVALGGEDEYPLNSACLGPNNACDGNGLCLKKRGQTCGNGSECATGFCADGVCCDSACTETCKVCNAAGVCTTITSGTDNSADQPCNGVRSCSGLGACKTEIGAPCSNSSECESSHCADGVCCNDDCSATCMACNLPNARGTCLNIPSGHDTNAAQTCAGAGQTCDGFGSCKLINGEACSSPSACIKGNCVDGVCCDTPCAGTCNACSAAVKKQGSDGTCGPIALGWDPENECGLGACDGQSTCKLDNGQTCGNNSQCLSGFCVDGVCCGNACTGTCMACTTALSGQGGTNGICKYIAQNLDPQNECANGACGGNGTCKNDIGQICTTNADCLSNSCSGAGKCMGPSCSGLTETCGSPPNVNCCDSRVIVGGSYNRDPFGTDYPATVSDFRLDTFEVTVGRFRSFVNKYPGSKPVANAGAHPLIANSGWNAGWNLPADQPTLTNGLKACTTPTWTDTPGTNENLPVNCVDWYVAFAFCAWDGGRLPTAAEWGLAATAGNTNLVYPWTTFATSVDWNSAVYNCQENGAPYPDCVLQDIRPVGSKPAGKSPYQILDMGGSMWEWNLDYAGFPMPCNDCANLTNLGNSARVLRGGSWMSQPVYWNQQLGTKWVPEMRPLPQTTTAQAHATGIRCARKP